MTCSFLFLLPNGAHRNECQTKISVKKCNVKIQLLLFVTVKWATKNNIALIGKRWLLPQNAKNNCEVDNLKNEVVYQFSKLGWLVIQNWIVDD